MKRYNLPTTNTAIFSWNTDHLKDVDLLTDLDVSTVFQETSEKDDGKVLAALGDFDVYLLTGDPTMELDAMKDAVTRAQQGYCGLVLDVEPYACDEWADESSRAAILSSYCEQLEYLYVYAQEHSVELILCIPYWYDELGYEDELERLVKASDGLCVMNYSRGNEQQNIAREYELAGTYYKKLWTAYELTQSDGKLVMDNNTYHEQGISSVTSNYNDNFLNTGIGLAYHDMGAVCGVNKREG